MTDNCPRCTRQKRILKRAFNLLVIGVILLFVYLLLPPIAKVREPAARMSSSNNLKQLALAMHDFNESHGHMPGANAPYPKGSGKKYPVSWRVLILPYVEMTDQEWDYHFDEPWDGAHNIGLLAQMPKFLRHPKADAEKVPAGYTYYRVFAGRPDAKPSAFFTDGIDGPNLNNITDGTSNTIMIVEADEAVPWTMPEILFYDRNQPLPKLGGLFKGVFHAALADGSIRTFRTPISDDKLRAWITKDGGEKVEDE